VLSGKVLEVVWERAARVGGTASSILALAQQPCLLRWAATAVSLTPFFCVDHARSLPLQCLQSQIEGMFGCVVTHLRHSARRGGASANASGHPGQKLDGSTRKRPPMGKGGQHDLASQPDLTDLAEGGQVNSLSAAQHFPAPHSSFVHPVRCCSVDHSPHPASAPTPSTAAGPVRFLCPGGALPPRSHVR
jgi:hypothetical protein